MLDLKEISTVIEWFRGFPKGGIPPEAFEGLMRARRLLATQKSFLGEYWSDLEADYDTAIFMRKKAVSEKIDKLSNNGYSQAGAKVKAEAMSGVEYLKERDAKRAFRKARNLWESLDDILNAMAGEFRRLENEEARIKLSQAA